MLSFATLLPVIDESGFAVFFKDIEGRYLFVNEAAASIIGRDISEILWRNDLDLFERELAENVIRDDLEVLISQQAKCYESTTWIQGCEMTFLGSKKAVRDGQGKTIGIVGISVNVTDIKTSRERESIAQVRAWFSSASKSLDETYRAIRNFLMAKTEVSSFAQL